MTIQELLSEYFTEDEVAQALGITRERLQVRRSLGENHPPYVKIGRKILYPKTDFVRWFKSQKLHAELVSHQLRRVK